MKTLNVIKVTRQQVAEQWGEGPSSILPYGELFIRCNRKGEINWEAAPIYTRGEIVKEQKRRPVHFSSGPKEQWEL